MRHDGNTMGWAQCCACVGGGSQHWPGPVDSGASCSVCVEAGSQSTENLCAVTSTLAARRHWTVTQVPAHSYPGHSHRQQNFPQ